jgi:hypothetical protein
MVYVIIILVLAGIGWWVWNRRNAVRQAVERDNSMGALSGDTLRQKRYDLLEAIGYVDSYSDLLPAGEMTEEVRSRRQAAYNRYEEGAQRLDAARNSQGYERVQMLFDEAEHDLKRARQLIDQLTDGTGMMVDARSPEKPQEPPLGTKCYFCGGTPAAQVKATLQGKREAVWVCTDCLQQIRDGRLPTKSV